LKEKWPVREREKSGFLEEAEEGNKTDEQRDGS
jgi:hypothetical protein